jgi:hypothetical protein
LITVVEKCAFGHDGGIITSAGRLEKCLRVEVLDENVLYPQRQAHIISALSGRLVAAHP